MVQLKYHINRSKNLINVLEKEGWVAAESNEIADFGMWASHGADSRQARVEVFKSEVSVLIDNKLSMYELLCEYGEHDITPQVFSALPKYLEFVKSTDSPIFGFLKFTHTSGGADVFCFNKLKSLLEKVIDIREVEATAIIQQGVRDVLLIDNRKFKVRTYVLVTKDWATYIYDDSLVVLHPEPYSPDSVDPQIQLSPNDNGAVKLLNDLPELSHINGEIRDIVTKTIECLKNKSIDLENQGCYHLFGYDFVCDAGGKTWLIEINGFPSLGRNDSVGKDVSSRMMNDFKNLIINPMVLDKEPQQGGFSLISESNPSD